MDAFPMQSADQSRHGALNFLHGQRFTDNSGGRHQYILLGDTDAGSRITCHVHGSPHALLAVAAVGVTTVYDERTAHAPGDSLSIQLHRSRLDAVLGKNAGHIGRNL